MLDLALEYGLFLAKSITVVLAVGAIAIIIFATARRGESDSGNVKLKKLNDEIDALADAVRAETMEKKALKAFRKAEKKADREAAKQRKKSTEAVAERPRVFVLDFKGDIRASGVEALRNEITAVLASAEDSDEVLIRLENAGGLVHEHGLAASQLTRIARRGLHLTVAVDKVAASGGYMMACVADRIVAAPFAVLGSIGVIAALPNFHRFLKEHGVDFEQFKAGQHKRTVTMFGENTDADREKFSEELQETHLLFKAFVHENRPALDLDKVATGEHWYGRQAIELGLCDEIDTSDDWLLARAKDADLFALSYATPVPWTKKLAQSLEGRAVRIVDGLSQRAFERRWLP